MKTKFKILIDTREQKPWSFEGISIDASETSAKYSKGTKYQVQTEVRGLGNSRGDYTVEGYEDRISIERKSIADLQGTLLAFGSRRDAFDRELEWLNSIDCAAVVIEGTLAQALRVKQRGKRSPELSAKLLHRRMLSCKVKYPKVSFLFCSNRQLAEVTAFRLLQMFVKKERESGKKDTDLGASPSA